MQVGGTLGTAILGAVMSAKVASLLPARWSGAHLPALTPAQLTQAKSAVTVGVAPVPHGAPAPLGAAITSISHAVFTSGMSASFLVASAVALVGAGVGLLTRQGREAHGPAML